MTLHAVFFPGFFSEFIIMFYPNWSSGLIQNSLSLLGDLRYCFVNFWGARKIVRGFLAKTKVRGFLRAERARSLRMLTWILAIF